MMINEIKKILTAVSQILSIVDNLMDLVLLSGYCPMDTRRGTKCSTQYLIQLLSSYLKDESIY